jgi:glucosyl-3-phosphoglycerate synthase
MAFAPDAGPLAGHKQRLGLRISVCLPARDEAATVGAIVGTVRSELVDRVGLVDEVVVLDDGSVDATPAAATAAGARVVRVADILPEIPGGVGKGNALWRSLFVTDGDVVCFLDADVRNFGAHFVTRLVEPLLTDPTVGLVKAHYQRPLDGDPHGGGRVTELVARPLLRALFPTLAAVRQPLAGEYAARRSVLEVLPFVDGWGVELGLLIDVADRFGAGAIAEADLGVRTHRNRPLEELAPQALAVLLTGLRRAGVAPVDAGDPPVADLGPGAGSPLRERPPMITVPAYRAKFGRELSA